MLGDLSTPQSSFNTNSVERRYDPLRPADIYRVEDSVVVGVPALPATGFAPERITPLPAQPAGRGYAQLGDIWLEIPALGARMTIVGVPADSAEGWNVTWLGDRAGYLEGTAFPTWAGNTGITGHVYMPNGKPGPFVNLHTMVWGQQVIVHMAGQQYVYEVRSVRRVWPQDISVLDHAELPTLTLITCQGYDESENSYHYRIAVRAVLIKVEPEGGASTTR
jgi:LPXTG-site transpeptidase (sortase) family protein